VPPDEELFSNFWQRVQKEADRTFGVDAEGSPVVRVKLLDRSRNEYDHWFDIPRELEQSYYHPLGNRNWNRRNPDRPSDEQHTPAEIEQRKRAIIQNKIDRNRYIVANLQTAMRQLEQKSNIEEHELRDELERPEKERKARIEKLQALKEKWVDIIKYLKDRGYTVDEVAMTYTYQSKYRDDPPKTRPIQKPADFDALMAELDALKKYKAPKDFVW
jgi:hypothetical protein